MPKRSTPQEIKERIEKIAELRAMGKSQADIAHVLNQLKILRPGGLEWKPNHIGAFWHHHTIRAKLHSRRAKPTKTPPNKPKSDIADQLLAILTLPMPINKRIDLVRAFLQEES